jgi:hypothetical protein
MFLDDLAKARMKVEAFYESTEDAALKEQLRTTIRPLISAFPLTVYFY